MGWTEKVSPADYLTVSNGLLGFLAITYIIDERFLIASLLILICIIIDGLDGYTARKLGSKHSFGPHLDAFSDTICFCFAPALLLYTVFYDPGRGSAWTDPENALSVGAPTLIVCFGILRLVRFVEADHEREHFLGLPTPANAFFLLQLLLLFWWEAMVNSSIYIVLGSSFVTSVLMLSNLHYPKLRGQLASLGIVGLLLSSLAIILELAANGSADSLSFGLTVMALLMVLAYIVGGPVYERRGGSR